MLKQENAPKFYYNTSQPFCQEENAKNFAQIYFPNFVQNAEGFFTHSRLTNYLNFVIILIETNERW